MRSNPGSTEERQGVVKGLSEYRKTQTKIAVHRDHGLCVHCYWFPGRVREYEEVHHALGRGTLEKEHYTNLLCLCRRCHQALSAMRVRGKHTYQEHILRIANEYPINPEFEHQSFDEQD